MLFSCIVEDLPPAFAESASFDVLIKNGTVYDGISEEARKADIAIRGDRIAAMDDLSQASAPKVIDATGLIVAPGFIDIHTHSDFNPFLNRDSPHKILQGVTTEVAGNCGMSAVPAPTNVHEEIRRIWAREGVLLPGKLPGWQSVAEYVFALESAGLRANLAFLAGHGNIRQAVIGLRPSPAERGEIEEMTEILKQALAEGALGLSLGLTYIPGIYASQEELEALARAVKDADALLAVHMRSEGKNLIPSIQETIGLAGKTGARVEISHLKAAGVKNWPSIGEALRLIEEARAKGLEIYADAYPYEASYAELGVVLPNEIYGAPNRLELIRDPALRPQSLAVVRDNFAKNGVETRRIVIAETHLPEHRRFEGKSLDTIAKEENRDALEILFDVLARENFEASGFSFSQNPEIVKQVLSQSYVSVGSDNVADFARKPHPRVFGTFPRFLEWTREGNPAGLGEAVARMTYLPAKVLGLVERGRLVEGAFADVVIFDLAKIAAPATYEEPTRYAEGMEYVIVNGKLAVERGEILPTLSGQVLRSRRKGSPVTRA
jgi:N-acyl-D-aspartate/D-glutamate deacylase